MPGGLTLGFAMDLVFIINITIIITSVTGLIWTKIEYSIMKNTTKRSSTRSDKSHGVYVTVGLHHRNKTKTN